MRALIFISIFFWMVSTYAQPKTYIFVFLHPNTSAPAVAKDSVERLMKGHLANIDRLAKEGKLIAAGPFEGGGGLFIFNSASKVEAQEWLKTDPGVQANRWNLEILPYSPQIGDVCKAKEPYEMVTYDFIRFSETSDGGAKAKKEHRRLVVKESEKGNVVTLGGFQPSGSILILRNKVMDELLESSPAVQKEILTVEKKKLWIAKGSFCEN